MWGTLDCIPIAFTYAVRIVTTITSHVVLTTAIAAQFAERLEDGLADYLPALRAFILGFTGTVFVLEEPESYTFSPNLNRESCWDRYAAGHT